MKKFLSSLLFISNTLFIPFTLAASNPIPEKLLEQNGTSIYSIHSNRYPVVDFVYSIPIGTLQEPLRQSGISTLIAYLLDKGAGPFTSEELSIELEKLGASFSSDVTQDYWTFSIRGPAQNERKILSLFEMILFENNFLKNQTELPSNTKGGFEKEFLRTKNRIAQNIERLPENFEQFTSLAYARIMYSGTPLFRSSIHSKTDFLKISLKDSKAYYSATIFDSPAIILALGEYNKSYFINFIKNSHFSKILKSEKKDTKKPVIPNTQYTQIFESCKNYPSTPSHKTKICLLPLKGTNQSFVRIGFPVKGEQRYPLALANIFLGGYFNSRLNLSLREKMAITYGVQSELSFHALHNTWTVGASTRTEMTTELIKKILHELQLVKRGEISDIEFSSAKRYLKGSYPLTLATLPQIATDWLFRKQVGYPENDGELFLNAIENLTLSSLKKILNETIPDQPQTILIGGNVESLSGLLKKEKLGSIQILQKKHVTD